MDINNAAQMVNLLSEKGFKLQESSPKELRFERLADNAEIIILGSPPALSTQIKINGESDTKLTSTIDDLKKYLKENVK